MLRAIIWLCLSLILLSTSYAGFSSEIAPPLQRQKILEDSEAVGETLLGMQSNDGYFLIVGISQDHKLQPLNPSPLLLTRPFKGLAVGLVALPLDKQKSLEVTREYILNHYAETSESIPVGLLALKLADEIHKRDETGSPLVFNALLIGQSSGDTTRTAAAAANKFRKLIKVDQTASFYECDAVAVGYKADRLNEWLEKNFFPQDILGLMPLLEKALTCIRHCHAGYCVGRSAGLYEFCVTTPHTDEIYGPYLLDDEAMGCLLGLEGDSGCHDGAGMVSAFVAQEVEADVERGRAHQNNNINNK